MNYTALSLAQTPPLAVPGRFLLTAPLFAALAALTLLGFGADALDHRWTPGLLAVTHLVTLGFLGLVMVGAVQQLLPVLLGATLPRPQRLSRALHLLLVPGTLALGAGLGGAGDAWLLAAAGLLGAGFGLFILAAGSALMRTGNAGHTARAMGLALVALAITVALGLQLAVGHAGVTPLPRQLTDVHLAWGIGGWIGLLVAGVAYQVVPMFQITPDYPGRLSRLFAPAVVAALLLWSAGAVFEQPLPALIGGALLALLALTFAAVTLDLQRRRRRRLPDVTLSYWRLAMVALAAAALLWLGSRLLGLPLPGPIWGVLLLVGFAMSAVSGMLYKILAFLVWLHLNNRLQAGGAWQGRIPNMKQIIPERHMRRQYQAHVAALVLLIGAAIWPQALLWPAGLVWLGASLYLEWNLLGAVRLYGRLQAEAGGARMADR